MPLIYNNDPKEIVHTKKTGRNQINSLQILWTTINSVDKVTDLDTDKFNVQEEL
jgi:hypothetical protein